MNKERLKSVDSDTLKKWLEEARKKRDTVAINAISFVLCKLEGYIQ